MAGIMAIAEGAFWFLLTFCISLAGGFVARRLKATAPFLVGGVIAVALFNVFFGKGYAPHGLSFVIQVFSGMYIALGIKREDVKEIRTLALPAVVMILCMLGINIVMSLCMRLSDPAMDLLTAMVSSIPGGVTESVVIADQMGADVPTVAILQMVRSVFAIMLFPPLIARLTRKERMEVETGNAKKSGTVKAPATWRKSLVTVAIAAIGGAIGNYVPHVPVSVLIFSMLAVAIANFCGVPVGVPSWMKKGAQVCTGVYVGCRVTMEFAKGMGTLVVPIILLLAGYLVFNTMLGLLLAKVFHLDKTAALFACIPAGVSDTALIAFDLTDDCTSIAFLQIVRLVSCILVFPQVIALVVSLVQ
jgi:membrane AbrB-like protein